MLPRLGEVTCDVALNISCCLPLGCYSVFSEQDDHKLTQKEAVTQIAKIVSIIVPLELFGN